MAETIYLCKGIQNENEGYMYFYHETMKEFLKNNTKLHKQYAKDEFVKNSIFKLMDYQSRTFDYFVVSLETSKKIQNLRDAITLKKYLYNKKSDNYVNGKTDYFPSSNLFGFSFYDFRTETDIDIVRKFINNNDNYTVYKRIIGNFLHYFYIYNPSIIKQKDILEQIKIDFKNHYEKDKFQILTRDYKAEANFEFFNPIRKDVTNFDKIKERFITAKSFVFSKREAIWLEHKIGIKVDKDKLKDVEYIRNLTYLYLDNQKDKINNGYLDFSTSSNQNADGSNDTDEVIETSDNKRRLISDYNNKLREKYGDFYEDEYYELENKTYRHVILVDKKIVLNELISYDEVPDWVDIYLDDDVYK